jgi:peptide chain release factor 1
LTVAVLPEPTETQVTIREADLEMKSCRGSGAGGQHRNVTASAVQLRHIPTDIMVRCESERSWHQNRRTALALLRAKVWERQHEADMNGRAEERREQVGLGMRCEKRRTIRVKDGTVVDHLSGRRWRWKEYVRGEW